MTSRFKKVIRYTIHFSQKSQQTNPLQVPQKGPYRKGGPPAGHFAYLSNASSFGFPEQNCFVQVTTSWSAPIFRRSSISIRKFLINSSLSYPDYCAYLMHVSFIFHCISGMWKVWSTVHIEECIFGCVSVDMLYFPCTGPWMRSVVVSSASVY